MKEHMMDFQDNYEYSRFHGKVSSSHNFEPVNTYMDSRVEYITKTNYGMSSHLERTKMSNRIRMEFLKFDL